MPTTSPHPDDLTPRGERPPPLDRKGQLLGPAATAVLAAALTIGGLNFFRPRFAQGTDPRSNTATSDAVVQVVRKRPQVVLTQIAKTSSPTHPLGYKVTLPNSATEALIGPQSTPQNAIAIDADFELHIGLVDGTFIEVVAKSPSGVEEKLRITAEKLAALRDVDLDIQPSDLDMPAGLDDARIRNNYFSGTWWVTPVDVQVSNHSGRFYVLAK
jgi:hypothetical protein